MKKTKAIKKKSGRGGRKPGVWELVKPEQIRAYREANKVSRATLAKMLDVSSTTVQNWETGKGAAVRTMQEKIKALLSGGGAPPPAPRNNGQHAGGYDSGIEATGRIVAAFLSNVRIKRGELGGVIQQVRSALM